MTNKTWGFCGLLGAPWLFLGMILEDKYAALKGTWFTGTWELLYITGWICSIIVLQQKKAAGESPFGKGILWVLLVSLAIAEVSNVVLLFIPTNQPAWWFALDMFWPVSNLVMLAVGIVIAKAGVLQGWKRWVPLAVGMWFPLAIVSFKMDPAFSFFLGGIYSAVAWSVLALTVMLIKKTDTSTHAGTAEPAWQ